MDKSIRIVHLPSSIGDNAYNLSLAEKSLGYSSEVYLFKKSKGTRNIYSLNQYDKLITFKNPVDAVIKIFKFYIVAIFKYDIFHFNGGMSLIYSDKFKYINHLDLIFLWLIRKKTIMTYQGSSGRITSYSYTRKYSYYDENDVIKDKKLDKIKLYRFKLVNRFVDKIYSTNPDLLNKLPIRAKFRPYTKLLLSDSKTIDIKNIQNKRIKIGHAPSDRKIKGTKYIIEAIKLLQNEGLDFEFILIEGIPRDKMENFYSHIDIFIDQLIIGWYGGASVEAMSQGVAVVAYICESDLTYLEEEIVNSLPVINANPDNIASILRSLLLNPSKIIEYKYNSLEYFKKIHDNHKTAIKILSNLSK